MDDGELDLSSQVIFSNPETSASLDDFLQTITTTCTHTHTCNPRSDKAKPKKPWKAKGNREAVRKYRQKKKSHTEHLEEEVKQLVKKLQGHGALEAEVVRLRASLVGIRAMIDGALGNYPFQTQCNAGHGLSCDAMAQCFLEKGVTGSGSCGSAVMNCHIIPDSEQYPN